MKSEPCPMCLSSLTWLGSRPDRVEVHCRKCGHSYPHVVENVRYNFEGDWTTAEITKIEQLSGDNTWSFMKGRSAWFFWPEENEVNKVLMAESLDDLLFWVKHMCGSGFLYQKYYLAYLAKK